MSVIKIVWMNVKRKKEAEVSRNFLAIGVANFSNVLFKMSTNKAVRLSFIMRTLVSAKRAQGNVEVS